MSNLKKKSSIKKISYGSDVLIFKFRHRQKRVQISCHAQFWRDIGVSPWVMRVIEQGYSLPFTVEPPSAFYE